MLLISIFSLPITAHAGVFSVFADKVKALITTNQNNDEDTVLTSQTMNVLKPVVVETESTSSDDTDIEAESLSATYGSLRFSTEEVDFPTNDAISLYEVKKGDTLSRVAKLFGVSKNTIVWANNLKSESISPGDTLVILPVTGIKHTVRKGDSIDSIAKKYKADVGDIANYNGISKDASLSIDSIILVPEGELSIVPTTPKTSSKIVRSKILNTYSYSTPDGFLTRPISGGRKSQGIHGHNGIDLASVPGTPVMAAASGQVIVAKAGGYNGGYGNMIVIAHDNNVQTVYAHLRAVYVTSGQTVTQGQVIGELGNTGRSTGPHLHFEVRGARNPF